jgi:hypothetical protein
MGTRASRVISSNAAVPTSMGSLAGGNADLHLPHRPVSDKCFAETRFFVPQLLQTLRAE